MSDHMKLAEMIRSAMNGATSEPWEYANDVIYGPVEVVCNDKGMTKEDAELIVLLRNKASEICALLESLERT